LGLVRQSVLIKRDGQSLLIKLKTECLKSETQALYFIGESRECFLIANIDN
jgi:hypothetical protein